MGVEALRDSRLLLCRKMHVVMMKTSKLVVVEREKAPGLY